MSGITGTCSSNSASALLEQHFKELQQQRLEERRKAEREAERLAIGEAVGLTPGHKVKVLGQPTELNLETGARQVSETEKGLFIDLYV